MGHKTSMHFAMLQYSLTSSGDDVSIAKLENRM